MKENCRLKACHPEKSYAAIFLHSLAHCLHAWHIPGNVLFDVYHFVSALFANICTDTAYIFCFFTSQAH
jgi:hypothetical protein